MKKAESNRVQSGENNRGKAPSGGGKQGVKLGTDFHVELKARLHALYHNLSNFGSVSPAQRYRTEGFCSAGLFLGLIEAETLSGMIAEAHQSELGERFSDRQGMSSDELIGTDDSVHLPVRMCRAPVWPSGGE